MRSNLIDDEAVCLDDQIQEVSTTTDDTTGAKAVDAGDITKSTNSGTADESTGAKAETNEVTESNNSGSSQARSSQQVKPSSSHRLPVQGGIQRIRRGRSRSRRPCAAALRTPSPSLDKKSHWRNGRDPPTTSPAYKCIDCRVWYTRPANYQNHITSTAHRFYVNKGSGVPWCAICRETKPNLHDFEKHVESQKHWKKYRTLIAAGTRVSVPEFLQENTHLPSAFNNPH